MKRTKLVTRPRGRCDRRGAGGGLRERVHAKPGRERGPERGAHHGAAATAPSATPAAAAWYTIGFSNAFGIGNGFREEQLCTAKAQALVSGQVASGTWIHQKDETYPQLQQIRDLIAEDADAIIFNPNGPDALNPALDEAQAAGIKTIAIDAYVTDPETLNLSNDQVDYGYVGAKWLFEQLGGKGNVYYMRGLVGHPADTDRHQGVMKALAENPGIKLLPSNDGVDTELGSRPRHQAHQRPHQQRRVRRRPGHLDVGHRPAGRGRDQGRRQAVRADRRRGPEGLRRAAPQQGRQATTASRASPSTTRPPSAARASSSRSKALNGETHRRRRRRPSRTRRATTSRSRPSSCRRRRRTTTSPTQARPSSQEIDVEGLEQPVAGQLVHRRLDRLHLRPDAGLQGPGRVASRDRPRSRPGDAGSAGTPAHRSISREPMTVTTTELAARGDRRLEDVRRGRRAEVGVAGRASGRGPRAAGRQRRRQEHASSRS